MTFHKVMILGCMLSPVWHVFGAELSEDCENDDLGSLIQVDKLSQKQRSGSSHKATVLGSATDEIDGSKASCRDHECAYGKLLCQELLRFAQSDELQTDVKIALYNGGGIRASIPKGEVADEDIEKVHPYGNAILVAKVPGSAIIQMVQTALDEHGAPGTGEAGNWLQVAGMSIQASWSGKSWTLDSIDVAPTTQYTIVTNQYIMDGNGGRKAISSAATSQATLSKTVPDLMKAYFKANSPVSPPAVSFRFGSS
jgi:5'-nucleotidase